MQLFDLGSSLARKKNVCIKTNKKIIMYWSDRLPGISWKTVNTSTVVTENSDFEYVAYVTCHIVMSQLSRMRASTQYEKAQNFS